jgi:hypothetical protein
MSVKVKFHIDVDDELSPSQQKNISKVIVDVKFSTEHTLS